MTFELFLFYVFAVITVGAAAVLSRSGIRCTPLCSWC